MEVRAAHAAQLTPQAQYEAINLLTSTMKDMAQEIKWQQGNMTEYKAEVDATYANVRDLDVSWLVLCGMFRAAHAWDRVVHAISLLSCLEFLSDTFPSFSQAPLFFSCRPVSVCLKWVR